MIGIDVGGANLKVAVENGVHTRYCPLWEGSPLRELLGSYARHGEDAAAVVMSGELADCFATRAEGISWIVDTVREVFPSALFYGTDARFHDRAVPALAAANWLASADFLRERHPGALLVDMGSTTTDVVPLADFSSLLGLTELDRLQRGYLVYTGLLRTTVPAVLREVALDGVATPVSAEYFACSADAHLVLGHIEEGDYAGDAPDRGGKDRASCLRRLARVVCSDLEEIGESGAMAVASAFRERQRELVQAAIDRARARTGAGEVLAAGIGAALLAADYGGRDLSAELGKPGSAALPALAVREVLIRGRGC